MIHPSPEQAREIEEFLIRVAPQSSFASSLLAQLDRRGLTDKQWAAAVRMQESWGKPRQGAAIGGNGLDALRAVFNAAKESGLKRPTLRIGTMALSLAPDSGRNPGCIYVKVAGRYQGKISQGNQWFKVREAAPDIDQRIQAIAADPLAQAIQHGKESGECACCGRELTDPKSIADGIGPVCKRRWFPTEEKAA